MLFLPAVTTTFLMPFMRLNGRALFVHIHFNLKASPMPSALQFRSSTHVCFYSPPMQNLDLRFHHPSPLFVSSEVLFIAFHYLDPSVMPMVKQDIFNTTVIS